jgi:hypothetical protein
MRKREAFVSSRILLRGIAVAIGLVVLWVVAATVLAIASTFIHALVFIVSLVVSVLVHPILFVAGLVIALLIAFLVRRALTRRVHSI